MTTHGDMIFEFGGVPVGSGRFSNPWGTHYFVDYDEGSDTDNGRRPDAAFKTIQAAVTEATGGDVIYIRPRAYQLAQGFRRYVEDVTVTLGGAGGSGVVATNANMSLIGVTQRGAAAGDMLGVRWNKVATNLTVKAPALHVENIGFFNEGGTKIIDLQNDGATRLLQGALGFSIYNCALKGDKALYSNGGNEIQIVGCQFQTKHDGAVGGIELVGSANACARPIIKHCEFIGGNANEMATAVIRTAAPIYDLMLRNCYFSRADGVYMNIAGTTNTGLVADCHFATDDVNALCTGLVAGVSNVYSAGMYDEAGIDDFGS